MSRLRPPAGAYPSCRWLGMPPARCATDNRRHWPPAATGASGCVCRAGHVMVVAMSAVEMAIEKLRCLDEAHARQVLEWLQAQEQAAPAGVAPAGARAMLGFARRFHSQARSTADWMSELREGEQDGWRGSWTPVC